MHLESGTESGEGVDRIAAKATLDDAQLTAAIASGDRAAETIFVERYQPQVRVMLRSRLRNADMKADLVQDVMLASISALRRGQLREGSKLPAFIAAVTRNTLHKFYRSSTRSPLQLDEPELLPDLRMPNQYVEAQLQQQLALSAIEKLDHTDRQILQLTLVEGLKPGVIAKQLNLRADFVRQRKLRAARFVINFVQGLSQNKSEGT